MANIFSNKIVIIVILLLVVFLIFYWLYATYFIGEPEKWSIDGVSEYCKQEASDITDLSPEDYPGEMKNIIRTIDQWFALKERKQLDTVELKDEFIARAEKITTLDGFFEVTLDLFSRMENAHTQMIVPMYGRAMRAELIEGEPVVTAIKEDRLPAEISRDIKIEEGAVIEKIDGVPSREWLETRLPYFSSSNTHWDKHGAVEKLFLRYIFEEEVRSYQYRNTEGDTIEIEISLDLPWNEARIALEPPLVKHQAYEHIGYLAVNSLSEGVVEKFDKALKELQDKESLILDLRQCRGGDSRLADEIFRRFIQTVKDVWTGVDGGKRVAEPYEELNYHGELRVLIGPYTFSAAEGLAFDLYDAERGVFVGGPTRGCSGGGPRTFMTEGGFVFRFPSRGVDYSASGREMEGDGLAPHIDVKQTMEDYLRGADTVLEYVLNELMERYPK